MKFGKTYNEKQEQRQHDIQRKVAGVRKFAILPVQTVTGEYVFLQYYWVYYRATKNVTSGLMYLEYHSHSTIPIVDVYAEPRPLLSE